MDWELDSLALTSFRIELYASDSCDPDGAGEGQTLIESLVITTDVTGHDEASTITGITAEPGQFVTATATVDGPPLGSTSEFSGCHIVQSQ